MRSVYIIYTAYFDFYKNRPSIGGIQSYITELCTIFNELNTSVYIVQSGGFEDRTQYNNVNIIQFKTNEKDLKEDLARRTAQMMNTEDLVLYATDTLIAEKTIFKNSIAIQHGIYWDIPMKDERSGLKMLISHSFRSFQITKRMKFVKTVVCVDYNFLNWYRTQVDKINVNMVVIPNYSTIPKFVEKRENDKIHIIFARRLVEYRGTRVFTEAIKSILDEYKNVNVTIAGSGPDKDWMMAHLDKYDRVSFIEYESVESLTIHADKDIAVVPTVGSEGTSLSLLEAMASKCAVICSDVGGMTNIVINGFNGIIVKAGDSQKLYEALKELIENDLLREKIAMKAYETVRDGFSKDKWQNSWRRLLRE